MRPHVAGTLARVFVAAALAAGTIGLPGCTTTQAHALPGGRAGVIVDCTGATLSWSHCYREAGEACPHGYDIVQKSSKGGGRIVAGDLLQVFGDQPDHRRLLIRCRAAAARDPRQARVGGTVGATVPGAAPPADEA